MAVPAAAGPAKEFLTDLEIDKIKEMRQIDGRVKIYMEAAALRLTTAEERLTGKEPALGDPLELFSPEEMLEGYYRIIESVMMNLDDAANMDAASLQREQKLLTEDCGYNCGSRAPKPNRELVGKAIKLMKSETEKATAELEILKIRAEEKKKEDLWNLINKAIDITNGAHEGADNWLSKHPAPADNKNKKK
jgi:hypothetical protein